MDVERTIALLADAGFDLVEPFDAEACARELNVPVLADPLRPLGLLVGNTRALWPTFLRARETDIELAAARDPIELYTERTFTRVVAATEERAPALLLFPHRQYAGTFLPFQRIAVVAGLAALAATQLLVHPRYGPWFALRGVILTDGNPPRRVKPLPPYECDVACLQAFERARAAQGPDAWRAWLAVRDACDVGREHRYSESQIAYHYTKDHRFLT